MLKEDDSQRHRTRKLLPQLCPQMCIMAGVLLLGLLSSCSEQTEPPPVAVAPPSTRSDFPRYTDYPPYTEEAHAFSGYLKGRVIGIDPGHGGIRKDDGWGFEGPINLGVAMELKRLLERDGATVVMTRQTDVDVALQQRPKKLEAAGAEIFISIHHNAIKDSNSNYTSTWYHGFPPHEPASLDLARALQRRVRDALRTPHKVPVPVMTDRLLYKNGLQVLRKSTVPAVLCEASFYTEPEEKKRLLDPEYQKREAYGFYLGLVDYFSQGTPTARLLVGRRDLIPSRRVGSLH